VNARALLAVHAVLGAVSVLAVTAQAVAAVQRAVRGRDVVSDAVDRGGAVQAAARLRAARFAWIAAAAVVAQFAVGLVLYPAYRVRVRALDFDRNAPIYSQLFDLKEHLAALSLALVVAAALAGRSRTDGGDRWPVAAVATTAALFVWIVAVLGVFVTARHAV
jgi:uncharacterized membrane protein YjgN (DUF898 family)